MSVSRRDHYRQQLIGNTPLVETRTVKAFGLDIELRQIPLLDVIGAAPEDPSVSEAERTRRNVARYLTQMAYVPGTDERIFEEGDYDQIMKWPFGKEYMKLQNAINELTGVDVEEAKEELKKDPLE